MTNMFTDDALLQTGSASYAGAPTEREVDDYLKRKLMRLNRQPRKVVYEFTQDPAMLHQYYRIREDMFIHVWGLKQFSGRKDAFDDLSETIISRLGNQCVGGCRLTFSHASSAIGLPMERDGFRIAHILPELIDGHTTYAEISRMAILPDFQNSLVMLEISRQLLKRAAEKNARYAFTLSPQTLARNYRKAAMLFGLKWVIRNDIEVPDREEFEGIKMVLSMIDLAPVYRKKTIASKRASARELVEEV